LALFVAAQGCKRQSEPARKRAVELAPSTIDLGVFPQNETVRGNVQLRNLDSRTMRLRSTASSTRCRWQDLPETLAGGTTMALQVGCRSDLMGPFEEKLTVLDAERGDAAATLRIIGTVEPIIGFDTAFVELMPEFGQTTSTDVRLVGKQVARAAPRIISTGGDVVTVAALRADAGPVQGFRLSCKGNRVGMHAGSIVVATGVAEQPTLTLSWGCRVPATLDVEPSTPYFNLHISGDRATTILVRSSQPEFLVKSARVIEGPFRATLEKPTPDGSTPIAIRVKNDEIPDEARAATGTMLIQSNDAREPRKEVPLFGFGKVNKTDRHESD
jgi:hypothetical protein